MNAWVLARSDRPRSWRFFTEALASDLHDVQGGTTAEGIHLGAMAGTVDLAQRCSTGLEAREEATSMTAMASAATSLEGLLGRVAEAMTGEVVVLEADTPVDVALRRLEHTPGVGGSRRRPPTRGWRGDPA